jgi:hypothetical protein
MPWVGFEPTISTFELAKTVHALDRAAAVMGNRRRLLFLNLLGGTEESHENLKIARPSGRDSNLARPQYNSRALHTSTRFQLKEAAPKEMWPVVGNWHFYQEEFVRSPKRE